MKLSYTAVNAALHDWRYVESELRDAIVAAQYAERQLATLVRDLPADLMLEGPFPGSHPDWLKVPARAWLSEESVTVSASMEGRVYEELERVTDALKKLRTIAEQQTTTRRGGASKAPTE